MRASGHGTREETLAAAAIAIARDAAPAAFVGDPVLPEGFQVGTPVLVLADEYGSGHVAG